MHDVLTRNQFFVREHVGLLKAANNFDVLDPESGQVVLHCREDNLGLFTKIFRFTKYKTNTPFELNVRTPEGDPILQVARGISIFKARIRVFDGRGEQVGGFMRRLLSIGGKFDVLDAADRPLCQLKGKWTSWEFRFVDGERELGRVTKKWAGLGKELFTSADNYMLTIAEDVAADDPVRRLILAAVLCIDMVLKE